MTWMTIAMTILGIGLILLGNLISFALAGPLTPEFDEEDWAWGFFFAVLANAIGIIALIYR